MNEIEELRSDVFLALCTLKEGDDVEFDGLSEDDLLWSKLNLNPGEIDDIESYTNLLSEEEIKNIHRILIEEGHMHENNERTNN
jgi:hypothetical protein